MKLPRNLTGRELLKRLECLDYRISRQRGSHIRITTMRDGEHHEVIPDHNPLKLGTLDGILKSIARHHGLSKSELLKRMGF
jgi:predicted RNA binding protein YcfA (HicA-like mRNA interferase family)